MDSRENDWKMRWAQERIEKLEAERDALKARVADVEALKARVAELERGRARVCKRCNGTGYEGGNVDCGYYCDACKGKGY